MPLPTYQQVNDDGSLEPLQPKVVGLAVDELAHVGGLLGEEEEAGGDVPQVAEDPPERLWVSVKEDRSSVFACAETNWISPTRLPSR